MLIVNQEVAEEAEKKHGIANKDLKENKRFSNPI
jgi:hypothetical protein